MGVGGRRRARWGTRASAGRRPDAPPPLPPLLSQAAGAPPRYPASWAAAWAAAGFSVAGLDNRGCGLSDGPRGLRCFVERFEDYVDDVISFAKAIQTQGGPGFAGLPVFVVGVSLGGCIAVHAAERDPSLFRGVILLAPMLSIDAMAKRGVNRLLVAVAGALSALVPTLPVARMPGNNLHPELQCLCVSVWWGGGGREGGREQPTPTPRPSILQVGRGPALRPLSHARPQRGRVPARDPSAGEKAGVRHVSFPGLSRRRGHPDRARRHGGARGAGGVSGQGCARAQGEVARVDARAGQRGDSFNDRGLVRRAPGVSEGGRGGGPRRPRAETRTASVTVKRANPTPPPHSRFASRAVCVERRRHDHRLGRLVVLCQHFVDDAVFDRLVGV